MVHELSQPHSSIIHDVLILVCLSGPLGHRYSAYNSPTRSDIQVLYRVTLMLKKGATVAHWYDDSNL